MIGFTLFMLLPIVQSVVFSLSDVQLQNGGYTLTSIGLYNYVKRSPWTGYRVVLANSAANAGGLPFIMVFSLVFGHSLAQEFRGRTLARVLFFLPVIVSTGVIATMESGNFVYTI
jgi:ABC-type sugar transport system permease subunit